MYSIECFIKFKDECKYVNYIAMHLFSYFKVDTEYLFFKAQFFYRTNIIVFVDFLLDTQTVYRLLDFSYSTQ